MVEHTFDHMNTQHILSNLRRSFNNFVFSHGHKIGKKLLDLPPDVDIDKVRDSSGIFIFDLYVREWLKKAENFTQEEIDEYNKNEDIAHTPSHATYYEDTIRLLRQHIVMDILTNE